MPKGVYKRNLELRPQTFKICEQCGKSYGPVSHLDRRFCGWACKVAAQTTGRTTLRRTQTKARSAQSLLAYHVKKGNILRPDTCERCGKNGCAIEGSHTNYSKLLDVDWLCISCHRKEDAARPRGVTVVQNLTGKTATRQALEAIA